MSRYLLINIAIIIFPLLFSFEKNLKFYKRIPALLGSLAVVSSVYILWDIFATTNGDWGFNPEYTSDIFFFNLPIEEALFFITVPYSIIFTFETIKFYLPEKKVFLPSRITLIAGLLLLATAAAFRTQNYTSIVMIFAGTFLLFAWYSKTELLKSRNFFITMGISYIPFLIVNYLLTEPPIIWYNPSAIWGGRFLTIPYEDFFYSFSMIAWWIYFYTYFLKRMKIA